METWAAWLLSVWRSNAPTLSAPVPTANEVSLTTFEADAGTTSSTTVQCDWVHGWQRRQRHSRRDASWITTRTNKSDQRWRTDFNQLLYGQTKQKYGYLAKCVFTGSYCTNPINNISWKTQVQILSLQTHDLQAATQETVSPPTHWCSITALLCQICLLPAYLRRQQAPE